MLRPKQTIAACAIHLPDVLAELAVSYMTPTVAGIEASIRVGNYELCQQLHNTHSYTITMAIHSGWPAIAQLCIDRFFNESTFACMWLEWLKEWKLLAQKYGDTEMIAVLSAHRAETRYMKERREEWRGWVHD